MLIRNSAPVFGANRHPYQEAGDWQFTIASRNLVSNDHYNGTVEQVQRQTAQNYVTNKQNLIDIGVSHAVNRQLALTFAMPFVNSSWASRDPAFPLPAPRHEIAQNGKGIGDISLTGRYWLFDTQTHETWNVAAGGGVKFPTGNSRAQDQFPGRTDTSNILRYVDQSVQPGDGGWGLMMEAHGFKAMNRVFLFGSASYLANPRDENNTPSILTTLGISTAPGTPNAGLGVNSVPDQYMTRLGASVGIWKGIAGSVAWRMEGLRRYDLFGDSHGWRRPGTEMFIEPGVSYQVGGHTFSFNVPIGYYYNRRPNPYTGNAGDATFPREVFLTSYAWRFGQKKTPPVSTTTAPEPPKKEEKNEASAVNGGSEGTLAPAAAPNVFTNAFGTACPVNQQ